MNIFTKLFSRRIRYNGITPDLRSEEEKSKDWKAEELVSAMAIAPIFRTVKEGQWNRYSVRNQNGSGSCVAQTTAKMLEIKRKLVKGDIIKFSASPIYKERSNKPQAGMNSNNALDIAVKHGSCREFDMPSENLSDAQIDALAYPKNYEDLNNIAVPTSYVTTPVSFDYVAGIIEREGCAMIWINTDYQSWCKDIPTKGGRKGEVVHSITGVDAFTFKGVQYILIEDSWGEFGEYHGQRLLTREFFNDAVFYCATFMTFTFDVDNTKRFAEFFSDMQFGQRNSEIVRLQDFLKSKGHFPVNSVSTGYYGNVTAKAVYDFQVKYAVASMETLNALKGKRVGVATRKKINEMR